MSAALRLTEQYFAYSNKSNLAQVAQLLSESSSYYSVNLGFFVGKKDIMAMQTAFHSQYQTVQWTIEQLAEIKPNVVEIEFSFDGRLQDGTESKRQGREHILIYGSLIQHIAVS